MTLRRASIIAAVGIVAAVAPAAAQWPTSPQQPTGQFPPVATQQAVPPAQQQPPPCVAEFMRLRSDTEQKGKAIRAASERHASPKEACGLFNAFTAAEAKLVKYAADNVVWCGIPQQIVDQLKQGHGKAMELRSRVCQSANQAQVAPRAPSLSDALGAPVPDTNNIKSGRGTYDTLTGTPLGSK